MEYLALRKLKHYSLINDTPWIFRIDLDNNAILYCSRNEHTLIEYEYTILGLI